MGDHANPGPASDSSTSKPIHVVHVIARLNVGGPAAILDVLQGSAGDTIRHTVLAGRPGRHEAAWTDVRDSGLHAQPIPGLTPAMRPLADLRALLAILRRLRQLRPDVVHTHTAKAGMLGRVAAMVLRIPRIHTFHGHVLTGYFPPAVTKVYVAIERWLAPRTDRLICVGEHVGVQLRAAGIGRADQYRSIPPAVSTLATVSRADARQALGLDAGDAVLLLLGRLAPVKRVDRAVQVLRTLRAEGRAATLLVAGGGELASQLHEQAADLGTHVRFLGWVADVPSLLAAADLILLTSDNEGMPVGLIEAASAGRPVVATDVGSVSEVVVDGQTGLVVPPDVDALTAACRRLLDDPAERDRMGAAAARRAAEQFSTARLVEQHEAVYREVLT